MRLSADRQPIVNTIPHAAPIESDERPQDFLGELAQELESANQLLLRHAHRLAAVAELLVAAADAVRRYGLPVTVYDAVEAGRDDTERDHLAEQARTLREQP